MIAGKMNKLYLLLVYFYCFFEGLSQEVPFLNEEHNEVFSELIVVDSSEYNGEKIYIFNDKSWQYAINFQIEYKYKAVRSDIGTVLFDTVQLFSENWNNYKTFSNQYLFSELSDSILIDIRKAVRPLGTMSSGFKFRWGRWHKGNDFACVVGTPVKSCWDGVVRYAQYNYGGYGNLVIVRHYNGLETYYAHLQRIDVKINERVSNGQQIALSGNTGKSLGPHLHFEARILDNAFDPKELFSGKETVLIHAGLFLYQTPKKKNNLSLKELFSLENLEDDYLIEQKVSVQRKVKRKTVGNM